MPPLPTDFIFPQACKPICEKLLTLPEEGFEELAVKFERVAAVEKAHEARYRKLLERLKNGEVFKEAGAVFWMCRQCGHLHFDINAPEVCPTCGFPKAYFERQATNY